MLTAVFIYSLTGGLLLGSASEDRFHLFHLLRFEIALLRLEADLSWVCRITHTHIDSSIHPTLMPAMNE